MNSLTINNHGNIINIRYIGYFTGTIYISISQKLPSYIQYPAKFITIETNQDIIKRIENNLENVEFNFKNKRKIMEWFEPIILSKII
jgi:hypothetical protein